MRKRDVAATITVIWGKDVEVSIQLSPHNWTRVLAGEAFTIPGNGYHYEGELLQDYWSFRGGLEGSLVVGYGDSGVGFEGRLGDADIKEHPVREPRMQTGPSLDPTRPAKSTKTKR